MVSQSTTVDGPYLAAVTSLVSPNGGRPSWWPGNLIIASIFGQAPSYKGEISTMNPDGSGQACLTCGVSAIPHESNDEPCWHPSGQWVVFESVDPSLIGNIPPAQLDALTNGGAGIDNNLWLMTADGQQFWQLTQVAQNEGVLHPRFSNDGTQLFWAAYTHTGQKQLEWMLNVAEFTIGSGVPSLTNVRSYQPLGPSYFYESHDWLPGDTGLVFSASPPGPFDLDIYTMDLSSLNPVNLTNSPGVWDEHAFVSPDGSTIAWISSQGYPFTPTANYGATLMTDLWLMDLDGSKKRQLTYFNTPGHTEYDGSRVILAKHNWSPDGSAIVTSLLRFPANGSPASQVTLLDLSPTPVPVSVGGGSDAVVWIAAGVIVAVGVAAIAIEEGRKRRGY